ncbi:TrbC family F-type conjugative pilus assembly protein [Desulfurobacterium crinifex]
MLRLLIFLFLTLNAYAGDNGSAVDVKSIVGNLEKQASAYGNSEEFKELKKKFELRKKRILEMSKEIDFREMVDRVKSQGFMDQISNATKEIIRWTGKAGNTNSQKDLEFYERASLKGNSEPWVLVVFMSSSMGRDFQLYIDDLDVFLSKQLDKWGKLYVVPYGVMRGVLEDNGKPSIMKTVLWLQNVLKDKKVQVLIDPILFRQYRVSSVPCLLLTKFSSLTNRSCSESYFGCGYSVFGFLRAVEDKTENRFLKRMLRELD